MAKSKSETQTASTVKNEKTAEPEVVKEVAPKSTSKKQPKAEPAVVSKTPAKIQEKTTKTKSQTETPAPAKTQVKSSAKTPAKANSKASAKVKAEPVEEGEAKEKRFFKCVIINTNGDVVASGRYCGKKPKQAAHKACTKVYKDYKQRKEEEDPELEIPKSIIFSMHECTRSSKHKKQYYYVGQKVQLEEVQEVPIFMKDPETGKHLLDKNGKKIPKLNPETGKPMIIEYRNDTDVRMLTDKDCVEYQRLSTYTHKDVDANIKKVKTQPKTQSKSVKTVKTKVTETEKAETKVQAKAPAKKAKTAPVVNKEENIKVKKAPVKKAKTQDVETAEKPKAKAKAVKAQPKSKTSAKSA